MKRFIKVGLVGTVAALAFVFLTAEDCSGPAAPPKPADAAKEQADKRTGYTPVNDVEGKNYFARLRLADSPATLIWCTSQLSLNTKPFTVPIAGKITSGGKRPFASQNPKSDSNGHVWYEEQPDAQGMYGTSGDYRYGFDPAGNYHDWYNMPLYCTSVPTIIQKNTTDIDVNVTGDLNAVDRQVEAALAACRKVNPDPSAPCPAAMAILGVK